MLLFAKMLKVGLVSVPIGPPAPGEEDVVHLLREIDRGVQRLFGRALAIREVDAGSCNGCEIEISGLTGPVYDSERFGIHFVASPRHADLLLVTGPVTRNMEVPLRKTYEATPDPKLVVAVGDCARTCGVFAGQLRRGGQRRSGHPGGRVRRRLSARAGRDPARYPDRPRAGLCPPRSVAALLLAVMLGAYGAGAAAALLGGGHRAGRALSPRAP